ncbi:hypothetical protein J1614_011612 [Plenodomus biglobosus]|nr:hypothetical protein J1614_011612 [Plenodomus biglobosus]
MATTTSKNHPFLLASAVAHAVLALGHTTKGLDQFKHPSVTSLPIALRGAVKAGWYEGSGFFLIMGILNYKWAQTGIYDIYDKSIAGVLAWGLRMALWLDDVGLTREKITCSAEMRLLLE